VVRDRPMQLTDGSEPDDWWRFGIIDQPALFAPSLCENIRKHSHQSEPIKDLNAMPLELLPIDVRLELARKSASLPVNNKDSQNTNHVRRNKPDKRPK